MGDFCRGFSKIIIFHIYIISQTHGILVPNEEAIGESTPYLRPLKDHRHHSKKEVPYGVSQFVTMVQSNRYLIVDKTPWIAEALAGPPLMIITRPRRFGKTTNLSMLAAFLTKDQNKETKDIFAGFAIANDPKFENIRRQHQQKYAVIEFSFSHYKDSAFTAVQFRDQFSANIRDKLSVYYREYEELFDPMTKLLISRTFMEGKDFSEVKWGFGYLINRLRDNGYKIAVLVDEYDAPFQSAIERDISATEAGKSFVSSELYVETERSMRAFYLFFFKGGVSPQPECGVMTGISYMAKTSIYSDISNFMEYTTLEDDQFGPYFGFLEKEVKWLIETLETKLLFEEFEEWYDGYHFGHSVIFNPFSVVSALSNGTIDAYWANSGSLSIIKHLIKYAGRYGILDLHFLLSGHSLRKEIHTDLNYKDLLKTEESFWNLLTNAGYVDCTKLDRQSPLNRTFMLRIPNKDVQVYLTSKKSYDRFVYSFTHLNIEPSYFEKFLFDRLNTRAPYYALRKNAGLETIVKVFESLLINFDFNHRSLNTLNMNKTPVYQLLLIKKDAMMDAISSHNDSHDIGQLTNILPIKENRPVMKKLGISKCFSTGIQLITGFGKDIGHEAYLIMTKTLANDIVQLFKDHIFPRTHG